MDGTIWLLLWALFLGFIAGYRYGSGRASLGMAMAFGFANGQPPTAPRRKEIDPVCHEPVSVDHAKPSVHEGRVYYFCSRECREIFEAAPVLYIGDAGTNDVRARLNVVASAHRGNN